MGTWKDHLEALCRKSHRKLLLRDFWGFEVCSLNQSDISFVAAHFHRHSYHKPGISIKQIFMLVSFRGFALLKEELWVDFIRKVIIRYLLLVEKWIFLEMQSTLQTFDCCEHSQSRLVRCVSSEKYKKHLSQCQAVSIKILDGILHVSL